MLREWQEILAKSTLERILGLITSEDEEATRLRQSTPFCGILPEEERAKIFKSYATQGP